MHDQVAIEGANPLLPFDGRLGFRRPRDLAGGLVQRDQFLVVVEADAIPLGSQGLMSDRWGIVRPQCFARSDINRGDPLGLLPGLVIVVLMVGTTRPDVR
jgi:hypothetical protein